MGRLPPSCPARPGAGASRAVAAGWGRPFLGRRRGGGWRRLRMLLVLSEDQKAHLGCLPRTGGAGLAAASALQQAPVAPRPARLGPAHGVWGGGGWRGAAWAAAGLCGTCSGVAFSRFSRRRVGASGSGAAPTGRGAAGLRDGRQ